MTRHGTARGADRSDLRPIESSAQNSAANCITLFLNYYLHSFGIGGQASRRSFLLLCLCFGLMIPFVTDLLVAVLLVAVQDTERRPCCFYWGDAHALTATWAQHEACT